GHRARSVRIAGARGAAAAPGRVAAIRAAAETARRVGAAVRAFGPGEGIGRRAVRRGATLGVDVVAIGGAAEVDTAEEPPIADLDPGVGLVAHEPRGDAEAQRREHEAIGAVTAHPLLREHELA